MGCVTGALMVCSAIMASPIMATTATIMSTAILIRQGQGHMAGHDGQRRKGQQAKERDMQKTSHAGFETMKGHAGISIDCLKTTLAPCQPPVVSHDRSDWPGSKRSSKIPGRAGAILKISWRKDTMAENLTFS